MKFISKILILLIIFGCSSESNDSEIIDEKNQETNSSLAIISSSKVSDTPFSNPREAIVYDDHLFVVNDTNTYKYDFVSDNWETINTNSAGVANYPYFNYNVSFIRDNKWHIINQSALWAFDFETNNWEKVKNFSNNSLTSVIGIYENNSLFLFSDIFTTVYKYDFENNMLIEHSNFELRKNYGQLVRSIFKIGDTVYFTKLTDYDKITIYKWVDNFTKFEFLGNYQAEYIAQGSAFVYNDNIIFGLGGETASDGNGNLTRVILNDKFFYYNTTKNEFGRIRKSFYEGRFVSIPVAYDNKFYLLGGRTIIDNTDIRRKSLDQIEFGYIEN